MRSSTLSWIVCIICLVFVGVAPVFAQDNRFTAERASITKQEIIDGAIIPVSWSVSNRLAGTNLVFLQVLPQESGIAPTYRNAELPRNFEIVPSVGDGWVVPILPDISSDVLIFEMRVINLSDNSIILTMTTTVAVIDENATNALTGSDILMNDCEYPWIGAQTLLDWYQPDTSLPGIKPVLCPENTAISLPAQYQPYEHGFTIHVEGEVFAFYHTGYGDRIASSESSEPALAPPDGLFLPADYFINIWQSEPAMGIHGSEINYAGNLGWATGPSQPYTTSLQKVSYVMGMGLAWGDFYMMTTPDARVVAAREGEGSHFLIWELSDQQ